MNRKRPKPDTVRQRPRYCVVVPAFNEEKRIGDLISGILEFCPEVVVVDDGSADQTAQRADQAGALVIRNEKNEGKGSALNKGFRYAIERGCTVIMTMDADGQHEPADLMKFMEAYERTGIPVIIGNRMIDCDDMPVLRRLTNLLMSWLLGREMGQYVPDTQCGFRLYRSDLIPYISTESEGFAAESEILLHIASRGIRVDSVRIKTCYKDSRSNIHPVRDTMRFLKMWLAYRASKKGFHVAPAHA